MTPLGFKMAEAFSRIATGKDQVRNSTNDQIRLKGAALFYPQVPLTTESFQPTRVTSRQGRQSTGKFSLGSGPESEDEHEKGQRITSYEGVQLTS